jgi:chemotaxis protein MotB
MNRPRKQDDHENADRWLLTYADLITLLLGLFVILYTVSKIDGEKYGRIIAALGGIFGRDPATVVAASPVIGPTGAAPARTERFKVERAIASSIPIDNSTISVTQNERGVTVHIMDELLFASGSADLKPGALALLSNLAAALRTLPNDIRVEGHTDDVPIQTAQFPSNWHLSVARAVNTAHYMVNTCHLVPERVSVVGYSSYHPLVPNSSDANRAKNRRVDIVIITDVVQKQDGTRGSEG